MAGERVLIVEDEPAVARGLEYGLRDGGFVVHWAKTGQQAVDLVRSISPQLILLDIRLPDISGFDICRHLRTGGYHMPILILTARDEEVDKVLGLELGADDYVVKPYSLREVISRVRALLRRAYGELAAPAGGQVVRYGPYTLDFNRLQLTRAGMPVALTPLEFRLLHHLIANTGRPCSREALIEAVWGYDGNLGSDRTVDVHVRHLRTKLEDDPAAPQWVVTVRGGGYKFVSGHR